MASVLLADDDPLLCTLVCVQLEAAGHHVHIVEDGQAALEWVVRECPDLIILDAMMPVLAGAQVLQRLKADPATSGIPVIMLTARKAEVDVVLALRSGAAEYVTKPFLPEEFLVRVARVLEGASRGTHEA